MDKETAKALCDLSNKMNEIQQKLDQFINSKTEKIQSDVDYISMMSDIDIPTESEVDINE